MFGFAQNPVLDFIAMAGAIAAGFIVVSDSRGPLANTSFVTRCAALLGVAFVTVSVLDGILVFLSPMFNGASTGAAVLEFVGGLLLAGGLLAAFMVLRGDLKIKLERPAPLSSRAHPPVHASGLPVSSPCEQCGDALKPDAMFCSNCGTRTQVLA